MTKFNKLQQMMGQFDKYNTNSLRKGRVEAFQADILQAYTLFVNHMLQPNQFTIKQFDLISQRSNLKFLIDVQNLINQCKGEQQQEEEYVQFLYQVLIDNYLIGKSQQKQIFCIFSLYLFYCRQDKKKKIRIDSQILTQLNKILISNKHNSKSDFMKVIKRLTQQAFSYHVKYGFYQNYGKQNIEVQKKNINWASNLHKRQGVLQNQNNHNQLFHQIRNQIPQLQASLRNYQLQKKSFNMYQHQSEQLLQCWGTHVTKRIQKLLQNYEELSKNNSINQKQYR